RPRSERRSSFGRSAPSAPPAGAAARHFRRVILPYASHATTRTRSRNRRAAWHRKRAPVSLPPRAVRRNTSGRGRRADVLVDSVERAAGDGDGCDGGPVGLGPRGDRLGGPARSPGTAASHAATGTAATGTAA